SNIGVSGGEVLGRPAPTFNPIVVNQMSTAIASKDMLNRSAGVIRRTIDHRKLMRSLDAKIDSDVRILGQVLGLPTVNRIPVVMDQVVVSVAAECMLRRDRSALKIDYLWIGLSQRHL